MKTKNYVLYTCIVALLSAFSLMMIPSQALSQSDVRYVSDVLFVPLRSGQGNQFRIVNAGLKSGTALTFLEQGETDQWAKVRTDKGIEGWIRTQYIMTNIPSSLKLDQTLNELANAKKTLQDLSSENKQLQQTNAQLTTKATNATRGELTMASELEKIKTLSAGAISLEQRYTQLLQKHQIIQTDFDVLKAENEKLTNDARATFMIYGVGILLFGVFLAYVLPAIKPNKRQTEWR
ncbi:TIGR04211 family SH3 domain-containing protein [Teredinibacter purpureus]|uniref:TIGR04211 family SH3 domain-containing protein n=1 Tax=Teredinibacter purpureus TaxID=2731756 RepID=UPI00069891AF|nr:TIGR04211 family SH3 domain-containing protein [Teredinibacter purpureus]